MALVWTAWKNGSHESATDYGLKVPIADRDRLCYQLVSTVPTVRNAWFGSWYWNCWRSIGARLQGASELVLAAESGWVQLSCAHANEKTRAGYQQ